jgi:arylsulfatase A-like enzyme
MNIVLVVVDSLRACSLGLPPGEGPRTPFLQRLARETTSFRRAYASECWTLPSHASMFTGLLPSQHHAHFQTMAYTRAAPTVAELLSAVGYRTEIVTRNSLFDGTIAGITRGFQRNTRLLAESSRRADPLSLLVALAKPRVRRLIRRSGFFGALQRGNRGFVATLARMGLPADRLALDHALERMAHHRRRGEPYFLFLNLYDVHAPYSPSETSPLRPFRTPRGCLENLALPTLLPRISSHAYLRGELRLGARRRRMLLDRYHRAIELMDAKLAAFYDAARGAHLLDDTMLIVTSDHGEAFGEHQLYFHDASVYDTHLHVPLWIHHPERAPSVVDDVVSTRQLHTLIRAVGFDGSWRGTLLDPAACRAHPAALAEHFHYPHTEGLLERYTHDIAAAVVGTRKAIVRRDGLELYELASDPFETAPSAGTIADFTAACRRDGFPASAVAAAAAHLRRWTERTAVQPMRASRRDRSPISLRPLPPLAGSAAAATAG